MACSVTLDRGGRPVLDHNSPTVGPSTRVGALGPNGVGKSSLLAGGCRTVPGGIGHRIVCMRAAISISDFDRRREEYETQGFDFVEWHLGEESELCDGLRSVNDRQVVIAQFDRRSGFAR